MTLSPAYSLLEHACLELVFVRHVLCVRGGTRAWVRVRVRYGRRLRFGDWSDRYVYNSQNNPTLPMLLLLALLAPSTALVRPLPLLVPGTVRYSTRRARGAEARWSRVQPLSGLRASGSFRWRGAWFFFTPNAPRSR